MPSQDAGTIARLISDEIICRHSCPRVLPFDRGANFLSKLVTELCRILDIKRGKTSSYHRQTNGLTERFNGTLVKALSMYTSARQDDWDEFIPAVLLAYRISPAQDSTGHSPFMLIYGREPILPIDTKHLRAEGTAQAVHNYLPTLLEKLEVAEGTAKANLDRARAKMKVCYDRTSTEVKLNVGDKVWIHVPKTTKGLSRKLTSHWTGSFHLVKQISAETFKVKPAHTNTPLKVPVHVNGMKLSRSQHPTRKCTGQSRT